MAIDEKTVRHVASLARLDLHGVDVTKLTGQMSAILEHVEQLKEVDVTGIPATAHAQNRRLRLREDEPMQVITREEALAGAPKRQGNFIVVPRTVEGGGSS
ncbi:MAG: Asp-tRNA(Asn)/Glu-tRNA(Gln) amidotransferase subunit GatC [Deltaproteobacteria bacterium]|nr:Asp-tRNA(Asn)/Glu-tRNA(Gln) amidotransferase subunit GatC [bacterium]MCB9476344.1 Asp-tRNA(Asn)/Glu-tRNA(Gln) amidotransferase subunit GatC [Deltaproteobacteria bacterium]MCB9478319.1 Asp-tRNA(Asn)/Glu-tRNA(Gln) amidotransferase subunit GatC [Deltaproteobacteria bacterium]MCB9489303.1 Asp-tRNA(Asn)/Glu-tRNA(Gln) amidotransferase subunit GatC [Deltaproteobacteria bacterium]